MREAVRDRQGTARGRTRVAGVVALAAALVVAATACDPGGAGTADDPAATVTVTGNDELVFVPATLSAPAGEVTVELTSVGDEEHTFVLAELDDREVVAASGGQTATGTVTLDAGTYVFYCSIEGHRAAGMEGRLTVS